MGKDGKNERRLRRWKWGRRRRRWGRRRRRWSEEEGATGSMLSGKMVTWQVNKVMIKNTEVLRPFGVNFCGTDNFSYQSSSPKKCLKGNKKEREREKEDRGREPFVRVRPPRRSVRREGEGGEMRVVVKEREAERGKGVER